jgi:hypothetical protein
MPPPSLCYTSQVLAMFKAGDDLRQDSVTLQILQVRHALRHASRRTSAAPACTTMLLMPPTLAVAPPTVPF